jgi:hypothetical protein
VLGLGLRQWGAVVLSIPHWWSISIPGCLRRGPRATSTGSGSRGSEWRGGGKGNRRERRVEEVLAAAQQNPRLLVPAWLSNEQSRVNEKRNRIDGKGSSPQSSPPPRPRDPRWTTMEAATGSGSRGSEWRGGGDDVGGGAVEAKGGGEVERGRVGGGGRGRATRQRGTCGGEVRDWVVARWRRIERGRRRHTMRYGRSRSMDGRTAERGRQTTLALLICCTDSSSASCIPTQASAGTV